MKPRNILRLTILLACLGLVGPGFTCEPPPPLRLELLSDKATYELGETPVFRLRATNVSQLPVSFSAYGPGNVVDIAATRNGSEIRAVTLDAYQEDSEHWTRQRESIVEIPVGESILIDEPFEEVLVDYGWGRQAGRIDGWDNEELAADHAAGEPLGVLLIYLKLPKDPTAPPYPAATLPLIGQGEYALTVTYHYRGLEGNVPAAHSGPVVSSLATFNIQ